MDRLHVILPCTGPGTALGLPYPDELHAVGQGQSLLELGLDRCLRAGPAVSRVTVVLGPDRAALLGLLADWSERLPLALCMAGDEHLGGAGDVLAAEHLFLEKNVVLPPTGHLVEHPELQVLPTMARRLDASDLVFGYVEDDTERLRSHGALTVEGNAVSAYSDRPSGDLARFNALAACFGFRSENGRELLERLARSTGDDPIAPSPFRVTGFPVAAYRNLATWPALEAFQHERTSKPALRVVA